MFSVDGQPGDWNIFANEFKNWISFPSSTATKVLGHKFSEATDLIQTVGLSDWGQVDQAGNAVDNAKFPFQMRFVPHASVSSMFPKEMHGTGPMAYMDDLVAIPSNSDIYEVYGFDGPPQQGGVEHHIGTLELDGSFVTSKFGDEDLFFRHQFMDDDLKAMPDWTPYVPKYSLNGKCPYEAML